MRAVSFVDKLIFNFKGSILKDSLALGDVDNDQLDELAVGNVHGDLYVFKGTQSKAWKKATGLGMIATVLIGDAMNKKKNCLVTISGEGICYVFNLTDSRGSSLGSNDNESALEDGTKLMFCHEQRLPANTKLALLSDIDSDGNIEMIIGLTDRVVRTYRWTQDVGENGIGTFVPLNKWEFASQIGSISLHSNANGSPCLLVSQPGGTYVRLHCANPLEAQDEDEDAMSQSLDYHPLVSTKMRNPNITTEILGNIHRNANDVSPYFAMVTLDGSVTLADGDRIVWSLQVDHQLFGMTKLDITGDGKEEIIVTSWDGQTYIINHKCQSVRFQFEESVCSFLVGNYNLTAEKASTCLVFVTFNNRILLYYDIEMPDISVSSLLDVMAKRPKTLELLKKLNADESNSTQLQQLYHWCLYGEHKDKE